MQLKDVTPIIKVILEERDKIPLMINTERYIPNMRPNHHGNATRGGIRKALRIIEKAPVVEAAPVVRCKDCKHRGTSYRCPFRSIVFTEADGYHYVDCTTDDSFCSFGAKIDMEVNHAE